MLKGIYSRVQYLARKGEKNIQEAIKEFKKEYQ